MIRLTKLLDSCETSKDKVVSVKTLDYLADYTEFHFGEEEKLQEEITYPGVEKHKEEHEKLRQVVRDLYNMAGRGRRAVCCICRSSE